VGGVRSYCVVFGDVYFTGSAHYLLRLQVCFLVGEPEGETTLGTLVMGRWIILKWILEMVWRGVWRRLISEYGQRRGCFKYV